MIAGLLALIAVAMVTSPAAEDRWLALRGDATATVALDRSSVIQGRHQKLWVRVKWTAIRDGVVYSDWLENFDCDTQSSFPSRIIEYAADGTVLSDTVVEHEADDVARNQRHLASAREYPAQILEQRAIQLRPVDDLDDRVAKGGREEVRDGSALRML